MKRLILVLSISLLLSSLHAQNYVVDKHIFTSGAGDMKSNSYQLNGFIGQPAISDISSNNFHCVLGYWPADYTYFDSNYYKYFPGDANMLVGIWPPAVIGSDVTYLVNYFRGMADPCHLDGFYAAADVNGDCAVVGSDVTYLVNYFRGLNQLEYCPDYIPEWPPLPPLAPEEWPDCDNGVNADDRLPTLESTR